MLRALTADGAEALLVILACGIGVFAPRLAAGPLAWIEAGLRRIAAHKWACIAGAGLAPVAIRIVLLGWIPIPVPVVHDEYSHLLAADTYAHGRLSNPPHPMWEHFESFHIIQQPAYASMEPPALGLVMAAGWRIFGHPWWGVCLAMGAMCAAVAWMLFEWFAPPWALAGSIIFVLRFGILNYWMNGYWGGAVPAAAAALLYGAFARLRRRVSVGPALVMGAALMLFINSRPLEGAMAALPVAVGLAADLTRGRMPWRKAVFRLAVPVLVPLACGFAWLAILNHATTGSYGRMAHMENREQYGIAPYLLWQPLKPAPVYRHREMERFYKEHEAAYFAAEQGTFTLFMIQKYFDAFQYLIGPLFLLAMARAGRWLRDRRAWIPATAVVIYLASMRLLAPGFLGHYAAPVVPPLMLCVVIALQELRGWRWRGSPIGLAWSRAVPLLCVPMFGWGVLCQVYEVPKNPWFGIYSFAPQRHERTDLERRLEALGGRHLVIVRYGPRHNFHREWVYNRADIDGSVVVWAREMDAERNRRLVEYFRGRRVWLLEPDLDAAKVVPYAGSSTSISRSMDVGDRSERGFPVEANGFAGPLSDFIQRLCCNGSLIPVCLRIICAWTYIIAQFTRHHCDPAVRTAEYSRLSSTATTSRTFSGTNSRIARPTVAQIRSRLAFSRLAEPCSPCRSWETGSGRELRDPLSNFAAMDMGGAGTSTVTCNGVDG